MKQQGAAGPIVAIVIGGALAVFALYVLIHAAASSGANGSVGGAGAVFGVILWGGLAALFLTLGIRAFKRVKREAVARSLRKHDQ